MPEYVTYLSGFIRHIKSKQNVVLSQADVDAVITQIEHRRLRRGLASNWRHQQHVRKLHLSKTSSRQKHTSSTAPQCPKCGGEMELRTEIKSKRAGSEYWGCATFPICRGMVKQL